MPWLRKPSPDGWVNQAFEELQNAVDHWRKVVDEQEAQIKLLREEVAKLMERLNHPIFTLD